jgi:dimethylhistidine N-methyltransferase
LIPGLNKSFSAWDLGSEIQILSGFMEMYRQFLEDVKTGLASSPKYLPSKYFYDKKGDLLFQEIMELDEYYLTRCESEILSGNRSEMLGYFSGNCDSFHLVEFGAGDASKTKVLIEHILDSDLDFEYNPIDISGHVIGMLTKDLQQLFPSLKVAPMNMEYFDAVAQIGKKDSCKKVILFLGSNIGNFTPVEAHEFFGTLAGRMSKGDQLMTGFDLKKDPRIILAAYNDSKGVTRDFNLNLISRIRRELHSDMDPDNFYHYPVYDPCLGAARSYLVSKFKQQIRIDAIPLKIDFEEGEPILMENSYKYDMIDIETYAERAGFRILANFYDGKRYFVNSLWEL